MEIIKFIGVVIVVIGFALKFDTIATVVVAGLAMLLQIYYLHQLKKNKGKEPDEA